MLLREYTNDQLFRIYAKILQGLTQWFREENRCACRNTRRIFPFERARSELCKRILWRYSAKKHSVLFFFGNKHCQRFNTYHGLKYMIGAEQLDQSIDVVARNVIEFKHSCWNRWNLRERSQSVILSQAIRRRPSVQLRPNLQSFFT